MRSKVQPIPADVNMTAQISEDLVLVEAFLADEFKAGSEDFNRLIRPLAAAGGKRLRARLCLLLAIAGSADREDRIAIAAAVEMLHLATLIHDDVLDQASVRRGTATIHCSRGNKVAILSGDYLFAKAFDIVARIGSPRYLRVFSRIISSLVEGEFLQMEDIFRLGQGTERYLTKTRRKTADFIEGCLELGALLGDWEAREIEELKKFGYALGMSFQITDDLMDYRERTETTGKPVGKDLREGVLTYPLLAVVSEENNSWLEAELAKIKNGGAAEPLLAYVAEQGGVRRTVELAEVYHQQAEEALNRLPDFAGKELLYAAADGLADRHV